MMRNRVTIGKFYFLIVLSFWCTILTNLNVTAQCDIKKQGVEGNISYVSKITEIGNFKFQSKYLLEIDKLKKDNESYEDQLMLDQARNAMTSNPNSNFNFYWDKIQNNNKRIEQLYQLDRENPTDFFVYANLVKDLSEGKEYYGLELIIATYSEDVLDKIGGIGKDKTLYFPTIRGKRIQLNALFDSPFQKVKDGYILTNYYMIPSSDIIYFLNSNIDKINIYTDRLNIELVVNNYYYFKNNMKCIVDVK